MKIDETKGYKLVFEKSKTGYGVYSPDIGGCVSTGANLAEAEKMMHAAIRGHFECLAEFDEPIPRPKPAIIKEYTPPHLPSNGRRAAHTAGYKLIFEKTKTGYFAYSPDVLDCETTGANLKEAEANMHAAILAHFEHLTKSGEPIPQPSTLIKEYTPEFAVSAV